MNTNKTHHSIILRLQIQDDHEETLRLAVQTAMRGFHAPDGTALAYGWRDVGDAENPEIQVFGNPVFSLRVDRQAEYQHFLAPLGAADLATHLLQWLRYTPYPMGRPDTDGSVEKGFMLRVQDAGSFRLAPVWLVYSK